MDLLALSLEVQFEPVDHFKQEELAKEDFMQEVCSMVKDFMLVAIAKEPELGLEKVLKLELELEQKQVDSIMIMVVD